MSAKRAKAEQVLGESFEGLSIATKLELIQQLIPLGLLAVEGVLRQEVEALAGRKYKREGMPGHVRWGKQGGSVYLADQKVPIERPTVTPCPEKDSESSLDGLLSKSLDEPNKDKPMLPRSTRENRD